MPEPNYIYTVMLNTTTKPNVTVRESTNSYNVTELNDDAIYNVRVAASCQATNTSDPVTVYGELIQIYSYYYCTLNDFPGYCYMERKIY